MPDADTKPWLVAAWPGMGNVAVIAAGYLVQKLGMEPVTEIASRGHFDIQNVFVKGGIVARPRMPRSVLYRWTNPEGGRDLYVFLAEAQPSSGAFAYAHALLDRVAEFGIGRVITFASLATQLHPAADPGVRAAATDPDALAELKRLEAPVLEDGQIGGLNGVMLGAAAERGISAIGILGEIPFFAVGVPNPKTAAALLELFSALSGIDVDLDDLREHAAKMEQAMIRHMERMQRQQEADPESESEASEAVETPGDDAEDEPEPEKPAVPAPPEPELDYQARSRIEELFEAARRDRSQAMTLKQELDRLGVFAKYEDRFLDLFKRAE